MKGEAAAARFVGFEADPGLKINNTWQLDLIHDGIEQSAANLIPLAPKPPRSVGGAR